MIHFSHIEKTGGTTIRNWLSALQGILGYGFLSTYNPGFDLPELPGRHEYSDPATGLSQTPLHPAYLNNVEKDMMRLTDRWATEMVALPSGAPVPAERAWRFAREYHDYDIWQWRRLAQNLTLYRSLAHSHGCFMPLVAVVREPRSYYVSHHVFMTGKFYAYVDRHKPGSRPHARRHTLSIEGYARELPDHQARWLTANLHARNQLTTAYVASFVKEKIDVLGTTERMGDFVRATCQASGLPPGLCLSRIEPAKSSEDVCFRGLRNALLQADTRVLGPSGPLTTFREVRRLCQRPRSVYKRIASSEAMHTLVRQIAPRDLELYAMAREATAKWRDTAPPEWLAPSLGGDALPVRFRWALHPPGTDVGSNASIVRVGQWCNRSPPGSPYPFSKMWVRPHKGNGTCVLLQV